VPAADTPVRSRAVDTGAAFMAQHRARRRGPTRPVVALMLAAVAVVGGAAALSLREPVEDTARPRATPTPCEATLHIVTARSFAPVLEHLAPTLESGDDCVHAEVDVIDGRAAAEGLADLGADVWIPDDAAWAGVAGSTELAEPSDGGPGTVVATSPIYMVTDQVTAERVEQAGGSWRGLADLVTSGSGVRLVVRDPAASGDGLVGVGAVAEAVWIDEGMDASAEALATALPSIRSVPGDALPADSGEVGLVAEYALTPLLGDDASGEAAATVRLSTLLSGSDYSAQLRYTWLPTAAAVGDPVVAQRLERVLGVLTGPEANDALAAAGLRRPDGGPPPGIVTDLPPRSAPPFDVLGAHSVDHVFATWFPEDRRSDLLVVIDVSGSMAGAAEGSGRPLIDLVREGVLVLSELLPDDSELALWEFGSLLDPPRDYRTLLTRGPLDAAQRQGLVNAAGALAATDTGTGLYDTILAAYVTARDGYRPGTPNHVVVFTDGKNEDDPGSISAAQLREGIVAATDPQRPVQLTVITFGPEPEAQILETALEPVDGYVDPLDTGDQVRAVFIHLAAGGVHN